MLFRSGILLFAGNIGIMTRMKTLVIVIIICLAVLSTPLSLKKLIDRAKDGKGNVFSPSEIKEWIDDPVGLDEDEDEIDEEDEKKEHE